MNLSATSSSLKTCIFGECDGSQIIVVKEANGLEYGKHCRCEAFEIMQNKIKFANISVEFADLTVSSFDTEMYLNETNKAIARNAKKIAIGYVKQFAEMKKIGKGLYLYGEARGSGKTRLAVSVGNALISKFQASVKFVTTLNLLDEIKSTWSDQKDKPEQTQSELLGAIKQIDVLILDDLGTEKPTSWVNEMFYNILNYRMTANKITIFTSNCRIEELKHDSRIVNRIMKMALPVKFPDESVRTAIAKQENEDILKLFMEGH